MKPRNQIIAIKSKLIPFNLESIKKVPHSTGYYEFYDGKKLLYIGVAGSKGNVGNLHHRLLSYQESDKYSNPLKHQKQKSKIQLRNYIDNKAGITVRYHITDIINARKIESSRKNQALFNQDSNKHHL